jgi:hypothetical protein
MQEDTLTRKQVKIMLEDRLMDLARRISALNGNDRRYSSEKNHLKSLYNLNLRLAKEGGLLDADDERMYI